MSVSRKPKYLHLKRPGEKPAKVALGQELKSGGAGAVYSIKDNPDWVVKIYHLEVLDSEGESYREKIECMLVNAPNVPDVQTGNGRVVQLAWPVASVYTLKGSFVGFAMPTVDFQRTTELEYALMEKQAKQHGLRHDLGARILLAHNLASVVSSIHAQGHAIVDLKPINLKFYKEELFVAVLDCDGFFIKTPGGEGNAPQVTPEYLAPEFHGASVKNPEHQDRFALAVIIFRMLNYNIHPFAGVPNQNESIPNEINARIKGGMYPYGKIPHQRVHPHPGSVHEAFPQELRELFDRAFSMRPALRPSAIEWTAVLNKFADTSKQLLGHCPGGHLYFVGMPCLSCMREQIINMASAKNSMRIQEHAAPRPVTNPASAQPNPRQSPPIQLAVQPPRPGVGASASFSRKTSRIPPATIVLAILIVNISALLLGVLWIGVPFFNSEQGRNNIEKHQQNVAAQELAAQEGVTQIANDPPPVAEAPVAQDDTPRPIIWSNHSFPGGALAVENKADTFPQETSSESGRVIAAPETAGRGDGDRVVNPEFAGVASGKEMTPDPMISAAKVVGETPSVSTGWIGVGIRALSSDFIHSMGLAEGQGVLISEVLNAGPAAQAGMAVGDILISVNKKTVGTGNILEVVSNLPVGNVAQFEVLRNDARMLLTVRVGQKP